MHFTYYDTDPLIDATDRDTATDPYSAKAKDGFSVPSDELRSLSLEQYKYLESADDASFEDHDNDYISVPEEYTHIKDTIFDNTPIHTLSHPYPHAHVRAPASASTPSSASSSEANKSTPKSPITVRPQFYRSFFKPGATFQGHQESGRHQYRVEVKLLSVDIPDSSVSGLLTIHNLTDTCPVLTTYFDGEIIGPKHSFVTYKEEWGSCVRNDIQHWARFNSWRDLNLNILQDEENRHWYKTQSFSSDCIYMRWKEKFLYPDANVTSVKGASFAGFYYVCFDLKTGSITGLYFHRFTDRFQQLNLTYNPDMGICQTYELC